MSAKTPEEICDLFRNHMGAGDLDSVMTLYDPGVVFLNAAGDEKRGEHELREELAPLAAARPVIDFEVRQVIRTRDIALMHTFWRFSTPRPMSVLVTEVARRQPDGTWRWLIGDPYSYSRIRQLGPRPP
jgi:ketosteroid isomerase-like protein